MPTLVTIPVSYFEIEIDYQTPDVRLLADRAPFIQGLFEALLPWSAKLEDVEILTSGKLSEQGVMLRLPTKNVSFFVGVNFCRFSRSAVAWENAQETMSILETCISALERVTGVKRAEMRTGMGMHLQVQAASFREVLRPFIAPALQVLDSDNFTTMASIVKWADHKLTIDGSGAVANAIYLKLEKTFPGGTPIEGIAKQLYQDELDVFQVLGVREATDESTR